MALDTIDAALHCPAVLAVLVVTVDKSLAGMVAALGAQVLPDEPTGGLNPAFAHGLAIAATAYPGRAAALLPADLPCLTTDTLELALQLSGTRRSSVVPDTDHQGTVLLTQPADGDSFRPQFGTQSFARHVAAGASPLTDPLLDSMRRDVDTLDNLRTAAQWGIGPRTKQYLVSSARRLAPRVRTGLSMADYIKCQ